MSLGLHASFLGKWWEGQLKLSPQAGNSEAASHRWQHRSGPACGQTGGPCLLCAGLPHCAPYNIHTDLTLLLFKTESCLAEFLMREEVFFSTDPWSSHSTFILYF